MNYRNFPSDFWNQIEATIESLKSKNSPMIAAFDADGTLWDTDLGENFFQYQIDQKHVALPTDPWNHYYQLKKIDNDPRNAYVWLAQINAGIAESELQQWAQQAYDLIEPKPIFSEQKKLVALLLKHGVQVYIVTASIKWAVVPGAIALGLTSANVIGVETKVEQGKITSEAILPITYRLGKVEALLKKTNGMRPFFCTGNTIGDYELLQNASHIRLAVSAASRDDKLFKAENELQQKADENMWWRHRFI